MIVWGEPGTNGQHSFHQMLHQGTTLVPCDFLVAATPTETVDDDRYDILVANCLAQAQALARGHGLDNIKAELEETELSESDISTLAPQKVMPGNRPSTTFLYRQLDPATLGRLISLFEHRVFVQGAVWGIDSFDQWGVDLANTSLPRSCQVWLMALQHKVMPPRVDSRRIWTRFVAAKTGAFFPSSTRTPTRVAADKRPRWICHGHSE